GYGGLCARGGGCKRSGGAGAVGNDQLARRIEHVEEAEEHVRGGVLDDKGAAALLTHHQPLCGQSANGLARGALAHTKFRGDLEFAGNELARLPNPRADAFDEPLTDLGGKRAGVRRGGGAHWETPVATPRSLI